MLAVLGAARGRPVGRERITSLLWPDVAPADARHSLVESLSVVRRELGVDPFLCTGDEVALDPGVLASDVEEFARAVAAGDAARAAELYAGPFLEGFVVKDAPEFDRWAEEERNALAAMLARVVEAEAGRREAGGDAAGAVAPLRRLATLDRYSSRVAVRLARALVAAGDTAAAVQHLTVHIAVLRQELELEPPPEVVATLDEIRRGTPQRSPAAGEAPSSTDATPPPTQTSTAATEKAPATPSPDVDRRSDVSPTPEHLFSITTVWLAAPAGVDRLRTEAPEQAARVQTRLRAIARLAAEHAGGTVTGVVGDSVLARFETPRAAMAAAVGLLRRWESWRARKGVTVELVVGVDCGRADAGDERSPDEATLRASVLRARAEPGTVLTTAAVARQAGPLAGVEMEPCGAAILPATAEPEPLVRVTVHRAERAPRLTNSPAAVPADRLLRVRAAAIAAVLLVAAVVLVVVRMDNRDIAVEALVEPHPERRSRIAILGCDASRASDSLRALCDGTMDLVALTLSRVPQIDVVRPPGGVEARPYWSSGVGLDSVALSERALVLSARLEDTPTGIRQVLFLTDPRAGGLVVAADTVEAEQGDSRLEETLSGRVATLLRRRLGVHVSRRTAGHGTSSGEARHWFMRARLLRYDAVDSLASADRLRQDMAIRDLAEADTVLMRAERADPQWAAPVVERALIALVAGWGSGPADQLRYHRIAREHADRAVRLDPRDPSALELRGRARWALTALTAYADSGEQLMAQALDDLVHARDLDDQRASTLYALSQLQFFQGQFAASLHTTQRAYRADPYLEGGAGLLDRQFHTVLSMGRLDLAQGYCA
ncbi:MAG TPA: BTAD domain-containing putative transcriptional regulator, partial [Longimicrobium sp.]|nr:BTAD domain-containing putative transcriptional regulator [Longimicrobium sp.]